VTFTGSQPQKGIVSYALSGNRQRPLAGTLHAAFFNTWRRFSGQVLYVLPPFIVAYATMSWAIERCVPLRLGLWYEILLTRLFRNHYLNSKAGRLEFADEE
jgi:ubiquinol-cytochrome c reductase subunit 8